MALDSYDIQCLIKKTIVSCQTNLCFLNDTFLENINYTHFNYTHFCVCFTLPSISIVKNLRTRICSSLFSFSS